MAIKKSDRKERYIEVLHLMLQGKNKEAFEKLRLMCGEDVGAYLLTDYDSAIEDIEQRNEVMESEQSRTRAAPSCVSN